jgi:peptidoglycan/xylan/chitin deacetylase (PgdA/CDA1 family)
MIVTQRLRAAIPTGVKEQVRLAVAARLEARVRTSAGVRGAALVIHDVAPRAGDPELEVNPALATKQLERIVSYLCRRYHLVHAADLVAAAHGRKPGELVPVALTFDDDIPSHLEHAAPALARHGATATAFLCGAADPFWWQRLQQAVDTGALEAAHLPQIDPRLTAAATARRSWAIGRLAKAIEDLEPEQRDAVSTTLAELAPGTPAPLGAAGARALLDFGWELGFHTRRHDVLVALDEDGLATALRDGRDWLPSAPRALAYPHGKAGPREAAAARAAGYEVAFTGAAEVVTEESDPHLIGRVQPAVATLGTFALQLARLLAVAEGRVE